MQAGEATTHLTPQSPRQCKGQIWAKALKRSSRLPPKAEDPQGLVQRAPPCPRLCLTQGRCSSAQVPGSDRAQGLTHHVTFGQIILSLSLSPLICKMGVICLIVLLGRLNKLMTENQSTVSGSSENGSAHHRHYGCLSIMDVKPPGASPSLSWPTNRVSTPFPAVLTSSPGQSIETG